MKDELRQQRQHCRLLTREGAVFRQIAFPVPVFDYLKTWQRDHEARTGERLNNNQALGVILREHMAMNEASEGPKRGATGRP